MHRANYGYLRAHDAAAWARAFGAALERACADLPAMRFVGAGLGMCYRAMEFRPSSQTLTAAHLRPAYRTAARRMILLGCDAAAVVVPDEVPNERDQRAPGDGVIRILNKLCGDTKNVVFIVSGRGRDQLAEWFAPCEKLGIYAEHGYFTRWSRDDPWQVMSDEAPQLVPGPKGCEAVAEPAMREATAGVYMETKETAIPWWHYYENADPALGPWQAGVLADEPASVATGSHVVGVKHQGVSKDAAVERVLGAMARPGKAPDFVACAGGGEADDEAMFAAVARAASPGGGGALFPAGASVFACAVGKKKAKSAAACYVEEPADVVGVLGAMRAAAAAHRRRPGRASDEWSDDDGVLRSMQCKRSSSRRS